MTASDLYTDRAAGACPIHAVDAENLDATLGQLLDVHRAWARATGWEPKPGTVLTLPGSDGSVAAALAATGGHEPFWALAAIPGQLPAGTYVFAADPDRHDARRMALAWGIGQYRFRRYSNGKPAARRLLAWPEGAPREPVLSAVDADALVRDLINTPAGDLGPAELSQAASGLAGATGAEFHEVVGEALLGENFPAIHAVGRASEQAPRLLELGWGEPGLPRVTLVGKGVCFDSGGLNIKAAQGMRHMKKDMGGAAQALGLARMIMDARLPVRLRVIIPAVENAVSGNAYRPGDVVRTRAGLTVEIGNTDAEGRMVLADALALADEDAPELLIDFATLTGAARVALGPDLPPLYTTDEDLAQQLARCGAAEGDPLWPMPLWTPYETGLSSPIADLCNVSSDAFAGSIYGALFLRRFVSRATAWAHLDVFAWNPRSRAGRPEGGMTQGVRAVFAWLATRYPAGQA